MHGEKAMGTGWGDGVVVPRVNLYAGVNPYSSQ